MTTKPASAASAIALACLTTLAAAQPVAHEPGWSLARTITAGQGVQSARYNPVNGLIYFGRRGEGSSDGLFRVERNIAHTRLAPASNVAALFIDHADGDVFFSEDYDGIIFRVPFAAPTREAWVSGFHSGDDDPVGMAIAPAGYTGPHLAPGEAIVTDRGNGGPDELWKWFPDSPENEILLRADDGLLVDVNDVAVTDSAIYLADFAAANTLVRFEADGTLTTIATSAQIPDPLGLAWDAAAGDLLVLDRNGGAAGAGRVLRVDPDTGAAEPIITGLTLSTSNWAGVDVSPDGRLIVVTESSAGLIRIFADCVPAGPDDDCDNNGVWDYCDIASGAASDCNLNGVRDDCEIAAGIASDCDMNGIPDDCPSCPPVDVVFIMDTSASMDNEGSALCGTINQIIGELGLIGVDLDVTLLAIAGTPGSRYPCLTSTVAAEYGTTVPDFPPPDLQILGDCPGGNEIAEEDFGRAVAVAAGLHPWTPGALRLIIPIADEGPWCGDPVTAADDASIEHAIDVANAHNVVVSPITGNGSSGAVIALAQQLAAETGGVSFSSAVPDSDLADGISALVLDACTAYFDCNRNGIPDDCDIAAGTSFDNDGNGIPDECSPCPCERDGIHEQVDVFDLLAFLDDWFAAPATPVPAGSGADQDGNSVIDVFDLLAYLDCWFPASAGNPCP